MYILMDIGCIECGESSDLLGSFETLEKAHEVQEKWESIGWRGGQHSYEIFELTDDINELGKKYLESAKKESE